jgi:hemerythrin-like domain-containing protein
MIFEHDQERSLVEGLEEALGTKKGKDFVYFARRLIQILRTHIYKEDHILFEKADELLSPEDDANAAHGMEEFDRQWREKSLPGLMSQLRALEWKYLGRTSSKPRDKRYA